MPTLPNLTCKDCDRCDGLRAVGPDCSALMHTFTTELVKSMLDDLTLAYHSGHYGLIGTAADFSDLHDYMDANTLGGLCADGETNPTHPNHPNWYPLGERDENGDRTQAYMDCINAADDYIADSIREAGTLADLVDAR